MSEETKKSKVGGWIKAVVGAMTGLLSGALMMYFSPLLDKVIKPAKPVANFAVELNGLTVNFHNRSSGGGKARWDFGDGSPLEFVPADQPFVTHTYPRPGSYTAKLTLTNVLGEENERSVMVEIADGAPPKTVERPSIVDLYIRPPGKVGEPVYAPATFLFKATADNAQHFIWDFGDGKGIHWGEDTVAYTFERPGTYTIRLCAFNGKEKGEEEATVNIAEPPTGALSVNLHVADEGVQVTTSKREVRISDAVEMKSKKAPEQIEKTVAASAGAEIVNVERKRSQNDNIEKVDWKLAPNRKSMKLIGQPKKVPVNTMVVLNEHLVVTEQKKSKTSRDPVPVAGMVSAPGQATLRLPPIPDDWTDVQRRYAFELRSGDRVLWQGVELPRGVPIRINGQQYLLTATQTGDRVQVQLASSRVASN